MIFAHSDYRDILKDEFISRCQQNARYSLRAYARDLALNPSAMSEIMHQKRGLSRSSALQVAKRLQLSKEESHFFCALVESIHARGTINKSAALQTVAEIKSKRGSQISLDQFKLISQWYCYALLELTKVDEFKSDHAWIAKRLGITEEEVKEAVNRLIRLQLLVEENGELVGSDKPIQTPTDIPSKGLRSYHKQILQKAIDSLDRISVDKRDITQITVAIDSSEIEKAKEAIKDFRRKLGAHLDSSKTKNSVYSLSIQLFPLVNFDNKENTQYGEIK